jgi:hypothetical protein
VQALRMFFSVTSVFAFLVLPVTSMAQNVAPAASPPAGLIVPEPAECDIDPRPISFLEELAATPPALPADAGDRFSRPGDQTRPWTLPAGTPADSATVAEITQTLREALACLNANDPLRFFAVFSDDMIRLFFAMQPIPAEALPMLAATPTPSPPDQFLGYLEIVDARVLPDGRVAILARTFDPTEPPYGVGTDFAILTKIGDRWVIDSLIENVEIVGEATPTP